MSYFFIIKKLKKKKKNIFSGFLAGFFWVYLGGFLGGFLLLTLAEGDRSGRFSD
jgi:hypothetical protein